MTSSKLGHSLLNVLGVALTASAFLVYHNTMMAFPIIESFFWFNLFAAVSVFCFPRDLTVLKSGSLGDLYPISPLESWHQSLKKGFYSYLLLDVLFYAGYFACVLVVLHEPQEGIVLTLLIISLAQPILSTLVSVVVLKDSCGSWPAFVIGTILVITGIAVYKGALEADANISFFDFVFWLTSGSIIGAVVTDNARAAYRRKAKIDPTDSLRSLFVTETLLSGILLLALDLILDRAITYPALEEILALAYLGLVPTAVAIVLINKAQDVIGIPVSSIIHNLRSLWVLLFSLVPLSWFAMETQQLSWINYMGLSLGVLGVVIVIWFAKGSAANRQNADSTEIDGIKAP